MEYNPSDSSGTDDDLPPSHQIRGLRGGTVTDNGRSAVGVLPYSRASTDMEAEIHRLEKEAYTSVLRAFKAQSDAITWEQEGLITELRKELRVSDDVHRELLIRVNADDIIQRIRKWRQAGGFQAGTLSNVQPIYDSVPTPSVSASHKRQKTSQSIHSLSMGGPSPALHSQPFATSMQLPSSVAKRGYLSGAKRKKLKSPQQYHSNANREPAEAPRVDPLVGRKVMIRWPEDNSFYEAVITDYNPQEGLHGLVYDIGTNHQTWEQINLKEISPEDIRWEDEDPGISNQMGCGELGHGIKSANHGIQSVGRGRVSIEGQSKKYFPPSQNGTGNNDFGGIEIFHTDTIIKEVERIFTMSFPDPLELEKAKKLLKEHEQSLINAIARLADASDAESEEDHHEFLHGQSMDKDLGRTKGQHIGSQNREGKGREASEDDQQDGDI